MFDKALRITAALACTGLVLAYLFFCGYYLSSSYDGLLHDYLAMAGCFYGRADFTQLFTPEAKHSGNLMCIAAIPLVLLAAWRLWRLPLYHWSADLWHYLKSTRRSLPWLIVLLLFCKVSFWWGYLHDPLCTDEAFSALNFADKPAFLVLSYYPVPNNHVLFNLLNHFVRPLTGDTILSGRLLSGLFYTIMLAGNFFLFRHFTRNNLVSLLCCMLLGLQLMTWGFGHQARGYALCNLVSWGSFVALYAYFFSQKEEYRPKALALLVCCNVLGMWTVPTYLYMLVCELLVGLWMVMARRKWYGSFWKAQALSITGIFLAYLPALCYSGFGALSGNRYISGTPETLSERWLHFGDLFADVVAEQTFGFAAACDLLALACFALPLLFLRRRMGSLRALFLLSIVAWIAVLVMLTIRQGPVFRAIGAQMHLSLLVLLLLPAALLATIEAKRKKLILQSTFVLLLGCAGWRMTEYNRNNSNYHLYGQDTRGLMNSLQGLSFRPAPEISVWTADECFMWPFVLKGHSNLSVYTCSFDYQQLLFLSDADKPLPDSVMAQYALKEQVLDYRVYERK